MGAKRPTEGVDVFRRIGMALAELLTPDAEELAEHYPTRMERAADSMVHAIGMIAALVGGGLLVAFALINRGVPMATASAIYALCLMAMLAASAVYNLTKPSSNRRILRRIDEAAIFLMIAGSYTPFTIHNLTGAWAWGMTIAVWSIAAVGALGKVLLIDVDRRLWVALYLALGWLVVVALKPMIDSVTSTALLLLLAGGVLYSTGVIFYVNKRLKFARAIWHGHVVAAAATQWVAVLLGVVLASPR